MRAELIGLPEPNWFWHGETLLPIIEAHRPLVCVELGTNRGCSAIATAKLIRTWSGHMTCVDTWETEHHGAAVSKDECQANLKAHGVDPYITLCQMRIDDAAKAWQGQMVDYLYIDADHTFDSVTSDLEHWWPLLKVGGMLAGDDYDDPNDTEVPPNVTKAWDTFEQKYGQSFVRTPTPGLVSRLIWGVKR